MSIAVVSLKIESVFGKSPATRVRRLICVLSVSQALEVRRRFRLCSGRAKIWSPSGIAVCIQLLKSGALLLYFSMSASSLASACSRVSALKTERMSAPTGSRMSSLGT